MATLTNYNPNESCCDEDRHKAPTLPFIHPLSLQDGGERTFSVIPFGVPVLVGGRRPVRVSELPHESWCEQDRHEAPARPLIHPLSLQDGRSGWETGSGVTLP